MKDLHSRIRRPNFVLFRNRKCGVEVRDFGPSWRDGIAFNALIHGLRPELIDMDSLGRNSSRANLENAFSTAEVHLGIPRLLDVEGLYCIDAVRVQTSEQTPWGGGIAICHRLRCTVFLADYERHACRVTSNQNKQREQ